MARLSVGENHHDGNLGHLDQVLIVLWSDWIGNLQEPRLVGCPVCEGIPDINAAVSPRTSEPAAFCHGRIIHKGIGCTGVHHHEHGVWLISVPCAGQSIAVFLGASPKYRRALHIMLEGEADLTA